MRDEIKKEFKIEDVVMKFIGNVQPVGITEINNERLENLEVLGEVFYKLFNEITDIIYTTKIIKSGLFKKQLKRLERLLMILVVIIFMI